MICIVCPRGCHIEAQIDKTGHIEVNGAGCARGRDYAAAELTAPVRTVTTTVRVTGAELGRLPVRSVVPVPKDRVLDTVKALHDVSIAAPVRRGTVIAKNVACTGIAFVATRDILPPEEKGDVVRRLTKKESESHIQ